MIVCVISTDFAFLRTRQIMCGCASIFKIDFIHNSKEIKYLLTQFSHDIASLLAAHINIVRLTDVRRNVQQFVTDCIHHLAFFF